MATVIFSSELRKMTGEDKTELKALVYRDLIDELLLKYKGLNRQILSEMAVSIDGLIIVDPLLETIEEEAEIHFFHFVSGG